MVVVVDGSSSIAGDSQEEEDNDWLASKNFAKDTVAAFADENLFVNDGTASFVQFASRANPGGTFSSQADFDAFVDAEEQKRSGTNIASGIVAGQALLDAAPEAPTSFMVVTTDGTTGAMADVVRHMACFALESTRFFVRTILFLLIVFLDQFLEQVLQDMVPGFIVGFRRLVRFGSTPSGREDGRYKSMQIIYPLTTQTKRPTHAESHHWP